MSAWLRALGRQATLVVYSGPTDAPDHSAKSQAYHRNLQTFVELGLASPPPLDVTVAIVLTRKVAYLEPSLRARGALVLYRRNVCYDMESFRVALRAMREQWRVFTHYITLNCGLVGPMLPPYLIGSTTHWTELLTRAVRGQTKLVGMFVCCGGIGSKVWPHIDSSLWVTDAQGLAWMEEDGAFFQCSQTEEGSSSTDVYHEVIVRYEMGMSRAMLRRGWNIEGLNLLQHGVDWRSRSNARLSAKYLEPRKVPLSIRRVHEKTRMINSSIEKKKVDCCVSKK